MVKRFVTVRGYASFERFTGGLDREGRLSVLEDTTVADTLNMLGVPGDIRVITMINGRHCAPDRPLEDGDKLVLFPPLEGG